MPCDTIPASLLPLPTTPKGSLKLGPGLQHEVPSTITANITGTLHIDRKKHAIWVENNKGRVSSHILELAVLI
jgi:exosome complex component RRP40